MTILTVTVKVYKTYSLLYIHSLCTCSRKISAPMTILLYLTYLEFWGPPGIFTYIFVYVCECYSSTFFYRLPLNKLCTSVYWCIYVTLLWVVGCDHYFLLAQSLFNDIIYNWSILSYCAVSIVTGNSNMKVWRCHIPPFSIVRSQA